MISSVRQDVRATRPEILFLEKVIPYPPAHAGDVVYSRGILTSVARLANVTVLCADNGTTQPGDSSINWHVTGPQRSGRAASIMSRWPLIAWKGASADYHARLSHLLERRWDAIVIDHIGSAHVLPPVLAYRRRNPRTKIVYVSHENEYQTRRSKYAAYGMSLPKRMAAAIDLLKVKAVENRLLREADVVSVINVADIDAYRRVASAQSYMLMTPGYSDLISPPRKIVPATPRRVLLLGGRQSEQKRLVLLDWLRHGHGILAAAGIETQIVGDVPDDLRAQIKKNYPDVQILGFVSDVGVVIEQARAGLIVDTVGGGFKVRLLSHVFQRLPIIGLRDAISGLPTEEGRGYLTAPDQAALARLVVEKIDDTELLNTLMETAFEDCNGQFSWDVRAAAFVEMLSAAPGTKSEGDVQ